MFFATEVSETKRTADTARSPAGCPHLFRKRDALTWAIGVGDFVAFDPRVEMNAGIRALASTWMIKPVSPRWWRLSRLSRMPVSSRSGHLPCSSATMRKSGMARAAGIPADAEELLVVDMAAGGRGPEFRRVPRLPVRQG